MLGTTQRHVNTSLATVLGILTSSCFVTVEPPRVILRVPKHAHRTCRPEVLHGCCRSRVSSLA